MKYFFRFFYYFFLVIGFPFILLGNAGEWYCNKREAGGTKAEDVWFLERCVLIFFCVPGLILVGLLEGLKYQEERFSKLKKATED